MRGEDTSPAGAASRRSRACLLRTAGGFMLLLLLAATVSRLWPTSQDPHNSACESCHVGDPQKGLFSRDISALCKRCHTNPENLSHPVGIVPVNRVPEDLHLDWEGRLTCATCHDVHQNEGQARYPYLLRRPQTGRPFCAACHRTDSESDSPMPHSALTDSAHGKPKFRETGSRSLPIDQQSINCLGCHDGSIAGSGEFTIRGAGVWEHGEDIGLTHPIGMDYAAVAAANRSFTPVGALNPAIQLFDGRVGCGSCHSPFSKLPKQLVIDNRGSQLCLSCHRV